MSNIEDQKRLKTHKEVILVIGLQTIVPIVLVSIMFTGFMIMTQNGFSFAGDIYWVSFIAFCANFAIDPLICLIVMKHYREATINAIRSLLQGANLCHPADTLSSSRSVTIVVSYAEQR